jgi:hypothetical protein
VTARPSAAPFVMERPPRSPAGSHAPGVERAYWPTRAPNVRVPLALSPRSDVKCQVAVAVHVTSGRRRRWCARTPIWVKHRRAFDCLIARSSARRFTGCGIGFGPGREGGGGLLPPLEPDRVTPPPNSNRDTCPFTHPPGLRANVTPPGRRRTVAPPPAPQVGGAGWASAVATSESSITGVSSAAITSVSLMRGLRANHLPCTANHLPRAVDQLQRVDARDFRRLIRRRRR